MIHVVLTVVGLLFVKSSMAETPTGFWCDHPFKKEVVLVTPQSPVDSCVADLIWGFDNVCYKGPGSELVSQINSKNYRWINSGYAMEDALLNPDSGAIEFTGFDSTSFYSGRFDILPCD